MTEHEARDDEREALITAAYNRVTGQGDEGWNPDTILTALGDLYDAARKHPEPEWEYGRITKTQWSYPRMDDASVTVLANTEGNIEYQRNLGYMIVRRAKAGPWTPVEEENR